MTKYQAFIARQVVEYGYAFDPSDLASEFIEYFNSHQRIKVKDGEWEHTGRVGVTTGWKPVFLLMRRSNQTGSSKTLTERDTITHVQRGRIYVPVSL